MPRLFYPFNPLAFHEFRLGLKRTQEELAPILGVSVSTIRNWEQGRSKPIPRLLRKLLEIGEKAGLSIQLIEENAKQNLH